MMTDSSGLHPLRSETQQYLGLQLPPPTLENAKSEVAEAWKDLRERMEERADSRLPLLKACARQPRLRFLMPFTSMNLLRFSLTSRFPFADAGCAWHVEGTGLYQVALGPGGPSSELTAMEAAALLERRLPADCRGITPGSWYDLEATEN